ncbi:hypothetical protein FHT86_006395 [Rhizobium sp. BK313]|nr:hypothetical protein [Rhizobium sp. BK313]MBB3458070.1 hypothetical protein [Rhizobium sp. BK313]
MSDDELFEIGRAASVDTLNAECRTSWQGEEWRESESSVRS